MKQAKALHTEATSSYARIKKAAEARVVRWEWSTAERHAVDPGYFETRKQARGRKLASEPAKAANQVQAGFDEKGRLAVERKRTNNLGSDYETFYRYTPEGISRVRYGYLTPKRVENVGWYTVKDGRIVSVDSIYTAGHRSRAYSYDARGHLCGLEDTGTMDRQPVRHAMDVETDDAGDIIRTWWKYPDGRRTLYWEKPSKTETLAARRKVILDGLRDAVLDAIARLKPKAPLGALCVHWTDADYKERLPPLVGVALASESAKTGDDPGEWKHWSLELGLDPDLAATCRRVNADIHLNKRGAAADKLMKDLAAALGKAKLPRPAKKAKSFVAYTHASKD